MEARWRIALFGSLRAERGDQVVTRFRTQKTGVLLAYLAAHLHRCHPRDALIDLLWPDADPEAGSNSLSTALSSLRRLLETPSLPPGAVLLTDRSSVRLNPEAVCTDLAEFEAALHRAASGSESERREWLQRAVSLYRGEFLAGSYESWVLERREWLAESYFQALGRLVKLLEQEGDLPAALEVARQGVMADPLREEGRRDLMRLYAALGQPEAALRQYQELQQHLKEELGAAPTAATRALARQIEAEPGPLLVPTPRSGATVPSATPAGEGWGGTRTFLLTDVEGSTKLWVEHPEAMRKALARHDALLTAAIERYGGTLLKQRGEGDSGFAVFSRATDAVAAALALQRALGREPWPREARLQVRGALHTGEAERREGDYHGLAVNHCARLRSVGHGGQTLLSQTSAALVRDQLAGGGSGTPTGGPLPGVSLRDLGTHRLKDLQRPEPIFQLMHPELPAEFPPLRSLEAFAHNLPLQLTRFIGREREIAELKRLLQKARLLTLTGAGGCGKTRLALQVGADLLDEVADGVWLVELAALSDPSLVPQTVATALGVRETPGRPLTQTLTDALHPKQVLLLLDNCEHLLAACAQLTETLLQACPQLQVLTTSREALGLIGEQTYRVGPLSLPDPEQLPPLERLPEFEAVQLFTDRALLGEATFALTAANAASVVQVCQRLDGIPLAIELAAARVKALPVEQIAVRLDDRFRLLTGGSRTALPRHQTLRALIDWSYDLLSEAERALLRRTSVFAGGWTLEAAEAVCADDERDPRGDLGSRRDLGSHGDLGSRRDRRQRRRSGINGGGAGYQRRRSGINSGGAGFDGGGAGKTTHDERGGGFVVGRSSWVVGRDEVLELLTRLVEQSLVVYEEQHAGARYRLLETVRQYFSERLLGSGEGDDTRGRHLDCFLQLAEEAEPQLTGAQQGAWLERLETEYDNLRAALAFSRSDDHASHGHPTAELGLRLAGALWRFWSGRGHLSEGRELLAQALASAPGATAGRAKALETAGSLAYRQADYKSARSLQEESLAIRRELGDRTGIAASLRNLGLVARAKGDYGAARSLHEESLAIGRELGNRWGIAASLNDLGTVARTQRDYVAARSLYEESVAIRRELGDRVGIADSLRSLGSVAGAQGDYVIARSLYEQSLGISRELGNPLGIAGALKGLGLLAYHQGEYRAARSLYEESLAIRRELGDRSAIAASLQDLGSVAYWQGEYGAARSLWEESLAIRRELGDCVGTAASLEALAALACEGQGEPGVGEVAGAGGRFQKVEATDSAAAAARLFGAAAALREAIGAPVESPKQEAYRRQVSRTRELLGEEAFAAAWAEGREMTVEQVACVALEEC